MCFNEDGLICMPRDNLTKRQRNLCNDELAINRDVVCCILASYLSSSSKPIKCFDGNAVCGIYGLLWKKYFGEDVEVTLNAFQEDDLKVITNNFESNNMKGEILNEDACILLRKNLYDFIFLNCKTNTTKYLDSLFSNVKEDAIIIITTSEDPALYWQAAEIALRNYNGIIAKTSFHREVAVRLVIAEMARASARYNKGLNILCTVVYKPEQSFTIIAKVKKGNIEANNSINNIKKLAYCSICENKEFLNNSYFLDKINNELNCECSKKSEGKVTIGIGPLWAGEIFDVEFIESVIKNSKGLACEVRICTFMKLILEEARCLGKSESNAPPNKKPKPNDSKSESLPYFYINTHRHSAKEFRLQKLTMIIKLLQYNGYRASRTHFDSEAIRTNAPINECIKILRKKPTEAYI